MNYFERTTRTFVLIDEIYKSTIEDCKIIFADTNLTFGGKLMALDKEFVKFVKFIDGLRAVDLINNESFKSIMFALDKQINEVSTVGKLTIYNAYNV